MRLQPLIAGFVAVRAVAYFMADPVNLKRSAGSGAVIIQHEWTQRMLAAEMNVVWILAELVP